MLRNGAGALPADSRLSVWAPLRIGPPGPYPAWKQSIGREGGPLDTKVSDIQ